MEKNCRKSCGICKGSTIHQYLDVASFVCILLLNILSVFQSLVPLVDEVKDHNFRIHPIIHLAQVFETDK